MSIAAEILHPTNLTVQVLDDTYQVYLTPSGLFHVKTNDESEIERSTYEDLQKYFEGVAQRRAKKAKLERQSQDAVIFVNDQPVTVTILGYTDAGRGRISYRGMPKGESFPAYAQLHPVFTTEQLDRYQTLLKAPQRTRGRSADHADR